MSAKFILTSCLFLGLTACSSSTTTEEPIVYSYPKHQLPREDRYSTTAWVQPPTVVPHNIDQSGFSDSDAPLLKPADGPPKVASPTLPTPAGSSRRY